MIKKLVTRTEFAVLAGVSGAAVTKACEKALKPATDGKRIDASHPAALAYIEKIANAKTLGATPGIDPMYSEAVEGARRSGRYSQSQIRRDLMCGSVRAQKIFEMMTLAGIVPEGKVAEPVPEVDLSKTRLLQMKVETKPVHVRGTAARRQQEIDGDDEDLEVLIPENVAKYADMTLREVLNKFGTASRFKDYLQAMKEISMIEDRHIKIAQMKGKLVSRELVQQQIVEPIDAAHIKLLRDGSKTIARRATALHGAGTDVLEIEKVVAELITSFIRPVKAKVKAALQRTEPTEFLDD